MKLTTHLQLVQRLRISIPVLPLFAFMSRTVTTLLLLYLHRFKLAKNGTMLVLLRMKMVLSL